MSKVVELEAELSDVAGELRVWKDLVEHPGWGKLKAISEGQLNERLKMYRAPLSGMDGVFGQEFTKGEASGIELFQTIPEIEVERLEAEQARLTKEIEDESNTEAAAAVDGANERDSGDGRELIDDGNDAFGG